MYNILYHFLEVGHVFRYMVRQNDYFSEFAPNDCSGILIF